MEIEDQDARRKGFTNLENSGKLLSMVIEPKGNQLKIFLTGKKPADVKVNEATVEASYYLNGVRKTLAVQRQVDTNKKPYYLIDKIDPNMKNLKINVKAGDHTESFDLPNLQ